MPKGSHKLDSFGVARARARNACFPHRRHMKYVTSSRRQIVMATLLGLAIVGAAMRYWAPNPSGARDIGTLLMVMWLPAVGNLVAFAVRQLHKRRSNRTGTGRARKWASLRRRAHLSLKHSHQVLLGFR